MTDQSIEQLQQEQQENQQINTQQQASQENTNNDAGVLTAEIKSELPRYAQQIFVAAFKAAQSNGISEDGARKVAWNSVKNQFEKSADGKWYPKGEVTAQHFKSVTSGGN